MRTFATFLLIFLCVLLVVAGTRAGLAWLTQPAVASPVLRITYSYAIVVLPADRSVVGVETALNRYGAQGYRQIYVVEPLPRSIGSAPYDGYIILERVN